MKFIKFPVGLVTAENTMIKH